MNRCSCGHDIVSHDPSRDGVPCCIRWCGCPGFASFELAAIEAIVDDFFAFQAAACSASPDCSCGRAPDHWAHRRSSET